jgi:DNA-damage-inducible protein D
MEESLESKGDKPFNHVIEELNKLRRINSAGKEYWFAREIGPILGYDKWDRFSDVIDRAIVGCERNSVKIENHFLPTGKMVSIGSGAQKKKDDYFLSRLACYLIAIEGDARKPEIAAAKSYFVVQTKRQEEFDALPEDEKRLAKRKQVAKNYTDLSKTAVGSGVKKNHLGIFHDKGYRGMYNERSRKTVNREKGLPENANLMDFIGYEELAAHDFKNTQTARQLKTLGIQTEEQANAVHYNVGRTVRETIAKLGNPMPETLPIEEDIKKVERRLARELKEKNE